MSINVVSSSIMAGKPRPYQASQVEEVAPAAAPGAQSQSPQDQVVVSERARSLASTRMGEKEPELRLSFPKLRELVTPPESLDSSGVSNGRAGRR
jgi:hypothetical protein